MNQLSRVLVYAIFGALTIFGFQNCSKQFETQPGGAGSSAKLNVDGASATASGDDNLDQPTEKDFDPSQLCSDYKQYFLTPVGTTNAWAGSYLVKTSSDSADYYVDPPAVFDRESTLPNSSPKQLAATYKEINARWKAEFGNDFLSQLDSEGKCKNSASNFCNAWKTYFDTTAVQTKLEWADGLIVPYILAGTSKKVAVYLPYSAARPITFKKSDSPDKLTRAVAATKKIPNPVLKQWQDQYPGYIDPQYRKQDYVCQ